MGEDDGVRRADLRLMAEPHRWPLVDLLPVTRHHGHDAIAETGRILPRGRGGVPDAVVVSGSAADRTRTERRYASFEDLYDDGWRVD